MSISSIRYLITVIVAALCCLPIEVFAQVPISEEALFYRCFAKLAQLQPRSDDALLLQVKAGTKSAAQACTEVLDKAKFTDLSGTKIRDENDPVAKAVLASMHQLHRSWATETGIFHPSFAPGGTVTTRPWYADNPSADYYTRALFSLNHNYDSVLTGADFLQPIRTNMNPPRTYNGVPDAESDYRLGTQQPFAPIGDILGIRSVHIDPIYVQPLEQISAQALPNFENLGVVPRAITTPIDINFPNLASIQGPLSSSEATQFAARIRGNINISTAGNYTFSVSARTRASLLIDRTRVLTTNPSLGTGDISLSSGTHSIEVQYSKSSLSGTSGNLILRWEGPGVPSQVVPASALSGLNMEYYTQQKPPLINLTGNEGGGFIGSHNYIMTTINFNLDFVPDGQEILNRTYIRAILADALCRELPVVRNSDAQQFVIPDSKVPFRQSANCSSCHSTMDRAAGVYRNLRWMPLGNLRQTTPTKFDWLGMLGIGFLKPSMHVDTSWDDTLDPDYALREPYGHFFFRNYRGELIDTVIRSLPDLASAIRSQDDFYVCAAKRYYKYFTGIDVDLYDPGDPSSPILNASQDYHHAKVISLGLRLKTYKSLRQLIIDIISSDDYRQSDYAVSKY